jgi:hypothetical protein
VTFTPVTTPCLRAVFEASGAGSRHAALAVQEWEALAPKAEARSRLPAVPRTKSCGP